MKKILFIIAIIISGYAASAQIPTTDSARKYTDHYIRNSAIEAFTNLRLNTLLKSLANLIDSTAIGTGATINLTRTPTGTQVTITPSGGGSSAVIDSANSIRAGVMTVASWKFLDSLHRGLISLGGGTTYTAGYGISIPSTVISADTGLLSTRAWRKQGIDSLATVINTALALKQAMISVSNNIRLSGTNISDKDTVSSAKTFTVSPLLPTIASTSDSSFKAPTTEWVKRVVAGITAGSGSTPNLAQVTAIAAVTTTTSKFDSLQSNDKFAHRTISVGDTTSLVTDTIVHFGDSFTAPFPVAVTDGYAYLIDKAFGSVMWNFSQTGTAFTYRGTCTDSNMVCRISKIPVYRSTLRYLTIGYTANDIPFIDTAAYATSIKKVIDSAIIARGWPAKRIIIISFFTGANGGTASPSAAMVVGSGNYNYNKAAKDAANSKGVVFVDAYNYMINNGAGATMGSDSVHPSVLGHIQIARAILLTTGYKTTGFLTVNGDATINRDLYISRNTYGTGLTEVMPTVSGNAINIRNNGLSTNFHTDLNFGAGPSNRAFMLDSFALKYNIGGGFNNTLTFLHNNNPVWHVTGSENFNIGTTTDLGYKLGVQGTAKVFDKLDLEVTTPGSLDIQTFTNHANAINQYIQQVWKDPNSSYFYKWKYNTVSGFNNTFELDLNSNPLLKFFPTTSNITVNGATDLTYKFGVNGSILANDGPIDIDIPSAGSVIIQTFTNHAFATNQYIEQLWKDPSSTINYRWRYNTESGFNNSFSLMQGTNHVFKVTSNRNVSINSSSDLGYQFGVNGSFGVSGAVDLNIGSDATGDIYYRNSGGHISRLPIGTSAQHLVVVSGIPAWRDTAAAGGTIATVGNNLRLSGDQVSDKDTLAAKKRYNSHPTFSNQLEIPDLQQVRKEITDSLNTLPPEYVKVITTTNNTPVNVDTISVVSGEHITVKVRVNFTLNGAGTGAGGGEKWRSFLNNTSTMNSGTSRTIDATEYLGSGLSTADFTISSLSATQVIITWTGETGKNIIAKFTYSVTRQDAGL